MVTIKQIAERAGVSTATVSNVLHGKTKKVSPANVKKIQQLIEEMGYVQRMGFRVLHNSSSNLIAVVINYHNEYEEAILSDPFYGQAVGFIEQRLRSLGYYMMFYSAADMDDIFRMVMAWDVDGVIALSFPKTDCEKLYSMIHKPVIAIDAHGEISGERQVPNIGIDDWAGGYLMIDHLLECGYEDIYVCATQDSGIEHQRWLGAQSVWKEHKELDVRKKLQIMSIGGSQEPREQFYQQIVQRAPFRRKTALFFLSDYMAIEAISYLSERGLKVPEHLGVAGYDDILYAAKFSVPRLTTIRQDIHQKAKLAVDELIATLQKPEHKPQDHVLPVSLVVRQSV